METVKIIFLSIVAAIAYGIVHDQVTARICVEYFTIGHPNLFGTTDPTLLAFGWGIVATWWVGLSLGLMLAAACRIGSWPKLTASDLIRPILSLMFASGCLAALAGIAGFIASKNDWVFLLEPMSSRVPQAKHVGFLTDLWIHSASYLVGAVGGLVLCGLLVNRRRKMSS